MDWLTIVFIIIFFVLPVIQQVLEAKRGKRGEVEEAEDLEPDWDTTPPLERPSEGSAPRRSPARTSSEREATWSDGWGEWPGQADVEAPAEGVPVEMRAPAEPARIEIEADESTVRPPPMADPARDESYRRMQEALARKIASQTARPSRPAQPPRMAALVTPRTSRTRRGTGLALNDPEQLRKAVILREVLGPPLALRSHEEDRAGLH